MTEQVPEDLTEAEEADRLDVDRSEEGDTASEVDRWEDEGGHDQAGAAWRAHRTPRRWGPPDTVWGRTTPPTPG